MTDDRSAGSRVFTRAGGSDIYTSIESFRRPVMDCSPTDTKDGEGQNAGSAPTGIALACSKKEARHDIEVCSLAAGSSSGSEVSSSSGLPLRRVRHQRLAAYLK
jgi:hypothetical protein